MYLIDTCPCCGSKELRRWPAIVSPFIADYACGTRPGDSHLCECNGCSFRFFDTRLSDAEIQKLYADYRGDAYFEARHRHEFWYSRKVNDGIGSDDVKIAARKRSLAEILGDRAQSFTTILDYGGVISGASDWPVSSPNVFWGIYQAETRKGVEGVLDAAQDMPREAMFYAYTRNSARAMNMLDSIGSLAPGKRADLILIDRDVLTISPEEMRDAKILWTIVGGKTVYQ